MSIFWLGLLYHPLIGSFAERKGRLVLWLSWFPLSSPSLAKVSTVGWSHPPLQKPPSSRLETAQAKGFCSCAPSSRQASASKGISTALAGT